MGKPSKDVGAGVFLVFISALGFSVYPILGKFVFAGGAGLVTVLFVRFFLAALFFWALTLWREGFPRLGGKTWLILWGMGGVGYSSMAGLFLSSVRYIPASLASLLLYAYPILVTFLTLLTRQEKFSVYKLLSLILSTLGLVLVLGVALQGINYFGVVLALAAALVYAIYIVLGNHVLQQASSLVTTSIVSTSAALTYALAGLTLGGFTWTLSLKTWLEIGGIALFTAMIAMLAFFLGMKRIGASSSSIISTFEPVMTVILAVVLLGEQLSGLQVLGGLLVVFGGILAVISPQRRPGQEIRLQV